jgi:hypothetical protein
MFTGDGFLFERFGKTSVPNVLPSKKQRYRYELMQVIELFEKSSRGNGIKSPSSLSDSSRDGWRTSLSASATPPVKTT